MCRVLIVDDNDDILSMLTSLLRSDQVECCRSVTSACEVLSKGFDPHVVILDAHLGDEDGTKFLRHPKFKTGKTRVMIFTGDSRAMSDELQSRLLYAGADVIVRKPVTLSVIEAHIWRLAKIATQIRKPDMLKTTGSFHAVTCDQIANAEGYM